MKTKYSVITLLLISSIFFVFNKQNHEGGLANINKDEQFLLGLRIQKNNGKDNQRSDVRSQEALESKNEFKSLIKSFENYSKERENIAFIDDIKNFIPDELKQKSSISKIKDFLSDFNNEVDLRMSMIDYLEDAAMGRLPWENSHEALQVVVSLMTDTNGLKQDLRNGLGEKIDLMTAWTQADPYQAKQYLDSKSQDPLWQHLQEGYENGLYFLGLPSPSESEH